jgi:hypothetical protein
MPSSWRHREQVGEDGLRMEQGQGLSRLPFFLLHTDSSAQGPQWVQGTGEASLCLCPGLASGRSSHKATGPLWISVSSRIVKIENALERPGVMPRDVLQG